MPTDDATAKKIDEIWKFMRDVATQANRSVSNQNQQPTSGVTPPTEASIPPTTGIYTPTKGVNLPSSTATDANGRAMQQMAKDFTAGINSLKGIFTQFNTKVSDLQKTMDKLSQSVSASSGKGATNPVPSSPPAPPPPRPPPPNPQTPQSGNVGFLTQFMHGNRLAQLGQTYSTPSDAQQYGYQQRIMSHGGVVGHAAQAYRFGAGVGPAIKTFAGGGGAAAAGQAYGAASAPGAAFSGAGAAASGITAILGFADKYLAIISSFKQLYSSLPGPQKGLPYLAASVPATIERTPDMNAFGRRMGYGPDAVEAYRTSRERMVSVGLNTDDVLNYGGQIQRQQRTFGNRQQVSEQVNNQLYGMAGYARAYGLDRGEVNQQRIQQQGMGIDSNQLANQTALAMARSGASNGSGTAFNADLQQMLLRQQQTSVTGASANTANNLGFLQSLYSTNDPAAIQGGIDAQSAIQQNATRGGTGVNNLLRAQAYGKGQNLTQAAITSQKANTTDIFNTLGSVFGPNLGEGGDNDMVAATYAGFGDNIEGFQQAAKAARNIRQMSPEDQKRVNDLQGKFSNGNVPGTQTPLIANAIANNDQGKQDVYNTLAGTKAGQNILKERGITDKSGVQDAAELLGAFGTNTGGKTDLNKLRSDSADNLQVAQSNLQSTAEGVSIGDVQKKWNELLDMETATVKTFSGSVENFVGGVNIFNKAFGEMGGGGKQDSEGNISINGPGDAGVAARQWLHGKIPGFATGTSSSPPGMHWVGEGGAELESGGGGNTIYTHGQSLSMGTQYASEETMKQMLSVLQEILRLDQKQDPSNIAFSSPGSFDLARTYNPAATGGFVGPVPNPGTIAGYPSSGGGSDSGGGSSGGGSTSSSSSSSGGTDIPDGNDTSQDNQDATAPSSAPVTGGNSKWNKFQNLNYNDYLSIVKDGSGGKTSPFSNQGSYDSLMKVAQQQGLDPRVMLSWTKSENNNATNISPSLINAHNYAGIQFANQPGAKDAGFAEPGHSVNYASFQNDDYFWGALGRNLSTGAYANDYQTGNLEGVAHRYAESPGNRVQQTYQYEQQYPSDAVAPTTQAAPSPQQLQGYMKNAVSQLGTSKHGGTGYDQLNTGAPDWKNYCEAFVEATLQDSGLITRQGPSTGKFDTANDAKDAAKKKGILRNAKGADVPAGAVVYADYGGAGHTGISVGNGQYISGGINGNIEQRNMATDLGLHSGGVISFSAPPGYHYDQQSNSIVPDDPTRANTPPIAPRGSGSGGTGTPTSGPGGPGTVRSDGSTVPAPPPLTPQQRLEKNIADIQAQNDEDAGIAQDLTNPASVRNAADKRIKGREKDLTGLQAVYKSQFGTTGPSTNRGDTASLNTGVTLPNTTINSSIGAIDARKAAIQKIISSGKNDLGQDISPDQLAQYGHELEGLNNQRGIFTNIASSAAGSQEPTQYGLPETYMNVSAGTSSAPGTGGVGALSFGPGSGLTNGGPVGGSPDTPPVPTSSGMPLNTLQEYNNEPDPAKKEQILQNYLKTGAGRKDDNNLQNIEGAKISQGRDARMDADTSTVTNGDTNTYARNSSDVKSTDTANIAQAYSDFLSTYTPTNPNDNRPYLGAGVSVEPDDTGQTPNISTIDSIKKGASNLFGPFGESAGGFFSDLGNQGSRIRTSAEDIAAGIGRGYSAVQDIRDNGSVDISHPLGVVGNAMDNFGKATDKGVIDFFTGRTSASAASPSSYGDFNPADIQSLIQGKKDGDFGNAEWRQLMKDLPKNIQDAVTQGLSNTKVQVDSSGVNGNNGGGAYNGPYPQAGASGWTPSVYWGSGWHGATTGGATGGGGGGGASAPVHQTPVGSSAYSTNDQTGEVTQQWFGPGKAS